MTLTEREQFIFLTTTWMMIGILGSFEGSVCPRCYKGKIVKDPWCIIYKDELFCSRCNLQITNLKDLLEVIRNRCHNLPDKDIVELLPELAQEMVRHSSVEQQFKSLRHMIQKPKKYKVTFDSGQAKVEKVKKVKKVKKDGTTKRMSYYKKHEFHEDVQEYWK